MVQTWQVTQTVSFPKLLFSGCAPKFSDAIVELHGDIGRDASTNSIRATHLFRRFFGCPRVWTCWRSHGALTSVFAP
jgi:hypothetical protein